VAGGPKKLLDLSPCERQVMELLVFGRSNGDIAAVLGKSALTVKGQVHNIIRKLNVENRTQAVAKHLAPHIFNKKE
jgi:DNA-binding NarL/FixJ family response regulator